MPFALAFRIAALTDSNLSRMIAKETHGPYSHVECWIDGPRTSAVCWSSREPVGVGEAVINLTEPSWQIVPIPTTLEQDDHILWFCRGSDGKMYDFIAVAGIQTKTWVHKTFARMCSEFCVEVVQRCIGMLPHEPMWTISPNRLATILNVTPPEGAE